MDSSLVLAVVVRWVHIATATLAIGGPFFVRFALMPAAARTLDEGTHQKLREAINKRWMPIVHTLITLFILTGLYNFLVETRVNGVLITARWKEMAPEGRSHYHMVFGIKMLCAFTMFFIASALVGRTATFAAIRKKARTWVTVFLLLAGVVLGCSVALRNIPGGAPSMPISVP